MKVDPNCRFCGTEHGGRLPGVQIGNHAKSHDFALPTW